LRRALTQRPALKSQPQRCVPLHFLRLSLAEYWSAYDSEALHLELVGKPTVMSGRDG